MNNAENALPSDSGNITEYKTWLFFDECSCIRVEQCNYFDIIRVIQCYVFEFIYRFLHEYYLYSKFPLIYDIVVDFEQLYRCAFSYI